jgi:hypothetical protein
MLHYNFSNYNPSTNLNAYLSSDAGESTSTDSDIGTSPSATTIASPPSSPQQLLPTSGHQQRTSYANKPQQQANLNNSLIRQHSYLNAVQFNDYKLNQAHKSNRNLIIKIITTYVENNRIGVVLFISETIFFSSIANA